MAGTFEKVALGVIAGFMIGMATAALITESFQPVSAVRSIQVLEAKGTRITLDSGGRAWVWDNQHQLSYRVSHADLETMVKGLK